MKYLVYGLVDPRSRLVRYIGKSTTALRRPREHGRRPGRTGPYCAAWIAELQRAGFDYEIVVLGECSRETLVDDERWWIAFGRACQWPLTNLTDGGEGAAGRVKTEAELVNLRAGLKRAWQQNPARRARLVRENPSKRPDVKIKQRNAALKRWASRAA